jgi:hypothetical protein
VYLTVDWSATEYQARAIFQDFVKQLQASGSGLGVRVFVLHEDQAFVRTWLSRLECTASLFRNENFQGIGNGSVIWLEHGKSVYAILYPTVPGTDLYRQTTRLFSDKCEQ